jgi:hypothetical protein
MLSTTCHKEHAHGTYHSHTEELFKQLYYKNGKEIMKTILRPPKKPLRREELSAIKQLLVLSRSEYHGTF